MVLLRIVIAVLADTVRLARALAAAGRALDVFEGGHDLDMSIITLHQGSNLPAIDAAGQAPETDPSCPHPDERPSPGCVAQGDREGARRARGPAVRDTAPGGVPGRTEPFSAEHSLSTPGRSSSARPALVRAYREARHPWGSPSRVTRRHAGLERAPRKNCPKGPHSSTSAPRRYSWRSASIGSNRTARHAG